MEVIFKSNDTQLCISSSKKKDCVSTSQKAHLRKKKEYIFSQGHIIFLKREKKISSYQAKEHLFPNIKAELGTRQHCRHNVTMFSSHNVFGYCIISIYFLWLYPSRHRDLFKFFLVPEARLHCRVFIVAKLKNCRVPSSE